jgi:transposase
MDEMDWPELDEKKLEEFSRRIALVETLSDEHIDENERFQVRQDYLREQGVSDRTIRNYLKRYREEGPRGLLFRRRGKPLPSARIHDEALRRKVLSLIEERPSRTIPQVRRMLERNPEFAPKIARVSNRTIYRFLNEHGLSQKARTAKTTDGGRRSFHQFQTSASMELVQGDGRDGIWLPDPERTGAEDNEKPIFLPGWMIIRVKSSLRSIFGMKNFRAWRRLSKQWSCAGTYLSRSILITEACIPRRSSLLFLPGSGQKKSVTGPIKRGAKARSRRS